VSYQNYTDTLQGVRKGAGYLAQVREKFPHAVLEEEWQTANQLTITIKTEMLPEVVEFLYYGWGGGGAGGGGDGSPGFSVRRLRRLAAGAVG